MSALQPTIPHLTRSSLPRCLQRHDISGLPEIDSDKPNWRKFKTYPIGYFHIDIVGDFLRHLIAAVPYKAHTVPTDNGAHLTAPGAGAQRSPRSSWRSSAASCSGRTGSS